MKTINKRTLAFGVNGLEMKATFEDLQRSGDVVPTPDYRIIHEHINYEVFLVHGGEVELITEEGKGVYRQAVLIVPPRFRHFSVITGAVTPFFLTLSRQSAQDELERFEAAFSSGGVVAMPTADPFYLSEALVRSLEGRSGCSEQRCRAYLELIFSDVLEGLNVYGQSEAEKTPNDPCFSIVEEFVNNTYAEGGSLDSLSLRLGLSRRQTSRTVRRLYGEPLTSVIRNKRLSVATALLRNTDRTVTEIAEEVGYASQSKFFCDFKERYGVTPLKARRGGRD